MVSMTETPSGNTWEPGPSSAPAGSEGGPVEWPPPADPGATGYAIGSAGEGSGQDQVTRQGQPPGTGDGPG